MIAASQLLPSFGPEMLTARTRKWPNDVLLTRKFAGILADARGSERPLRHFCGSASRQSWQIASSSPLAPVGDEYHARRMRSTVAVVSLEAILDHFTHL